jgi:major membrane immunogen (membrane-anchored lipoprotein)
MKKYGSLSLFIVCLMVLISMLGGCTCSSGFIKNGVENNTPTKMSMLYEEFTGYKQTHINVEAGKPVEVVVSIVTEKGSIDAYIARDNDIANSSYEGNDIPTSSFTVTLAEAGRYTIRVDAEKHTGSYSFSWGD